MSAEPFLSRSPLPLNTPADANFCVRSVNYDIAKKIAELSSRMLRRDLFKCIDIGARLSTTGSDEKVRFQKALTDCLKREGHEPRTVLSDEPRVTGYDWYSWGDESALKKVLIHDKEQNRNFDIGGRSDVVKALKQRQFFRIYVPDREWQQKIEKIWEEISK